MIRHRRSQEPQERYVPSPGDDARLPWLQESSARARTDQFKNIPSSRSPAQSRTCSFPFEFFPHWQVATIPTGTMGSPKSPFFSLDQGPPRPLPRWAAFRMVLFVLLPVVVACFPPPSFHVFLLAKASFDSCCFPRFSHFSPTVRFSIFTRTLPRTRQSSQGRGCRRPTGWRLWGISSPILSLFCDRDPSTPPPFLTS